MTGLISTIEQLGNNVEAEQLVISGPYVTTTRSDGCASPYRWEARSAALNGPCG